MHVSVKQPRYWSSALFHNENIPSLIVSAVWENLTAKHISVF